MRARILDKQNMFEPSDDFGNDFLSQVKNDEREENFSELSFNFSVVPNNQHATRQTKVVTRRLHLSSRSRQRSRRRAVALLEEKLSRTNSSSPEFRFVFGLLSISNNARFFAFASGRAWTMSSSDVGRSHSLERSTQSARIAQTNSPSIVEVERSLTFSFSFSSPRYSQENIFKRNHLFNTSLRPRVFLSATH